MIPTDPFGPHTGITLPTTPTYLPAVSNPYFHILRHLPSSDQVFRSTLLRKSISDETRLSYITAYEQFRYANPAASAHDPDSLDSTLTDYIEEEYEDAAPNATPQRIRNLLAIISIAAPATKGKLSRTQRLVKSWAKNRTPSPSAAWTQQMAAAFAFHMLNSQRLRAGTAVIVQFAALLRPSELFSLTWDDILFLGDLWFQHYGLATAGLLVRNAKTAMHIAQKQFIPISCPAAITLLMDLRSRSSLDLPVFHYLNYAPYRSVFISALTYFELPTTNISLNGARGGAAFLAHQKGSKPTN